VADLAGGVLLLVMVVLVILSVIGRRVPEIQVPRADQMLPDLLVWLSMLGAAAALRRNEHLGITLLLDRLQPMPRRVLSGCILIAATVFFVVVLIRGANVVGDEFQLGISSPAGYASWLVTLALPVGAGLCLLYIGVHLIRIVRRQADTATSRGAPL
jgi:TRAP-type C4-dicarboxylate transport system permease small subunit